MILLDTNVIVAALVPDHPHNSASVKALESLQKSLLVVAAHSIAEAFSTLTRQNRPFRVSGAVADDLLSSITANVTVVALSSYQTLAAIRDFSAIGTGPRLYDYLIGATGIRFGADTIVTWNTRHFTGLFPAVRIVTPDTAANPVAPLPPS